jgi:hypothetical protein
MSSLMRWHVGECPSRGRRLRAVLGGIIVQLMSKPPKFFFSYALLHGGRIAKYGKGSVHTKSHAAVQDYFDHRGYTHYSSFRVQWHTSESAAFKNEKAATAAHKGMVGRLPSRNARAGGGGGRVYRRCTATKLNGERCMNSAYVGTGGLCGVHSR